LISATSFFSCKHIHPCNYNIHVIMLTIDSNCLSTWDLTIRWNLVKTCSHPSRRDVPKTCHRDL
jgi:hypothetical protein